MSHPLIVDEGMSLFQITLSAMSMIENYWPKVFEKL